MPIESETEFAQYGGWSLRFRDPVQPGRNRLIVLIHGWTGDETVMWIFARRLPMDCWVLAPRGPVQAQPGGYGWVEHGQGISTPIQAYLPAVDQLAQLIRDWPGSMGFQPEQTSLMGFSQGAALTYTYALIHPEGIESIAGLAGFIPPGGERFAGVRPLAGRRVFIAHGLRDDTVPIEKAREAAALMEVAGASVTSCVADTGHKLGVDCLHGLEAFFLTAPAAGTPNRETPPAPPGS